MVSDHSDRCPEQKTSHSLGIATSQDLQVILDHKNVEPNNVKQCADDLSKHWCPGHLELDQEALRQVKLAVEETANDLRDCILACVMSDIRLDLECEEE